MKRFFRKIFRLLRRICENYELLSCWALSLRKSKHPQRIVVIQNSHLGDFVLSIPFFKRLKDFCNTDLVLVSDHRIEEIARASGFFGDFIGVDMKRASGYRHLLYRWRTLLKLRKISAGKVVQCFGVGATDLEDCMALAIRADERYAFVDSMYNVQRSGVFYDALKTKVFNRTLPYRNELDLLENENNYADFITGKNAPVQVGDLDCFEPLPCRSEELQDYVLLIPGADDPRRRWAVEKFARVADAIAGRVSHWKFLIAGSPAEQEIMEQLYAALPEKVKAQTIIRYPAADKLASIKQLMSDIKYARMLITNDTAPLHIAAKYNVKTYCMTGGWHWGVFVPCKEYRNTVFLHHTMSCYKCGSFCKYATTPFRCLQDLTAETVLESITSGL